MAQDALTIVEVIYPGFTQLDFTGPHTVLSRLPGATCVVASPDGGEVEADGGLVFARTVPVREVAACDILFLPGGMSTTDVIDDEALMAEIRRIGSGAKILSSVCTGSLVLGAAGWLKGRRAACHWSLRDQLAKFGAIPDPGRVVRDGPVITGGGVTAGIDFALTLAADLTSPELAQALQLAIEYAPDPPFNAGRPETAPPGVLAAVTAGFGATQPGRIAAIDRAAARLARGA